MFPMGDTKDFEEVIGEFQDKALGSALMSSSMIIIPGTRKERFQNS
jgi:hypothetical protein